MTRFGLSFWDALILAAAVFQAFSRGCPKHQRVGSRRGPFTGGIGFPSRCRFRFRSATSPVARLSADGTCGIETPSTRFLRYFDLKCRTAIPVAKDSELGTWAALALGTDTELVGPSGSLKALKGLLTEHCGYEAAL